jgi:hypothetical protein
MSTTLGKEYEKSVDFNKNLLVFSEDGTHNLLHKNERKFK